MYVPARSHVRRLCEVRSGCDDGRCFFFYFLLLLGDWWRYSVLVGDAGGVYRG